MPTALTAGRAKAKLLADSSAVSAAKKDATPAGPPAAYLFFIFIFIFIFHRPEAAGARPDLFFILF